MIEMFHILVSGPNILLPLLCVQLAHIQGADNVYFRDTGSDP